MNSHRRAIFLSLGYSERSSGLHHVEHVSDMTARETLFLRVFNTTRRVIIVRRGALLTGERLV